MVSYSFVDTSLGSAFEEHNVAFRMKIAIGILFGDKERKVRIAYA